MAKIRKVDVKAVASAEISVAAQQDLEIKDPENAREIIGICGPDCKCSSKEHEVRNI